MTGCAALGCTNSRTKGFLMKVFPKDKKRRAIWAAAIHRPNLTFTSHSALCEIHFATDAWEKVREDGSRKLKISAVPTLGIQAVGNKQRQPRTEDRIEPKSEPGGVFKAESETVVDSEKKTDQVAERDGTESLEHMRVANRPKQRTSPSPVQILNTKLDLCIKLLEKSERQRRLLLKKLRALRIQNKRLRAAIDNGNGTRIYLNDDQQEIIEKRYKKCKKWSSVTLKEALKLKLACGNNGYKELLKQNNIPLPSLRTLCRKSKDIDFDGKVENDAVDLLKPKLQP